MKLGFTGTRQGMTKRQKETVARLVREMAPEEVHHGDAIGADAGFHRICSELGIRIVVHPPENPADRAFTKGDQNRQPRSYMARNQAIVATADLLIAVPNGNRRNRGSGTWKTVSFAQRKGRPIVVVFPDGTTRST